MAEEPPEVKPDPTPLELSKTRLPDPITQSEKEIYEGKIRELKEENEQLRAENEKLKKPVAAPKKKSLAERFNPIG